MARMRLPAAAHGGRYCHCGHRNRHRADRSPHRLCVRACTSSCRRSAHVIAAIALYVAGQVMSAYRWRLIGRSVGSDARFARVRPVLLHRHVLHVLRPEHARRRFHARSLSRRGGDRRARARVQLRAVRPPERARHPGRDRRRGVSLFPALRTLPRVRADVLRRRSPSAARLSSAWCLAPWLVRLLFAAAEHRIRRFVERRSRSVLARPRHAACGLDRVVRVPPACRSRRSGWSSRALGSTVPFSYICVFHPLVSAIDVDPDHALRHRPARGRLSLVPAPRRHRRARAPSPTACCGSW